MRGTVGGLRPREGQQETRVHITNKRAARFESARELDRDEPKHTPEQEMWRAVVICAVSDACLPVKTYATEKKWGPAETRSQENAQRAARKWLTEPSADLTMVCDLAGFNPEFVLKQARLMQQRGWK